MLGKRLNSGAAAVEARDIREKWLEELRRVSVDHDDEGLSLKSPQITYNGWRIGVEHKRDFRSIVLRPPEGKAPSNFPPNWHPCRESDQKKHWRYRVHLGPDDFQAFISERDSPFFDGGDGPEKVEADFTKPGESPDWSWDEHVLALDLYMENPKSPPGKGHAKILALSALLGKLGERMGVARAARFRNANGVYMKLMNFRRLDPHFQAEGKSGLSRGADLERRVWDRYSGDLEGLRAQANAIRLAVEDTSVVLTNLIDDNYEAEEGAVVLRLHVSRERDAKLARQKREKVFADKGKLACDVCQFDFSARYGEHGRGFIEVHHRKPVSKLAEGSKTSLADLALVCANCHRMLHRKGLLAVEALREILSP